MGSWKYMWLACPSCNHGKNGSQPWEWKGQEPALRGIWSWTSSGENGGITSHRTVARVLEAGPGFGLASPSVGQKHPLVPEPQKVRSKNSSGSKWQSRPPRSCSWGKSGWSFCPKVCDTEVWILYNSSREAGSCGWGDHLHHCQGDNGGREGKGRDLFSFEWKT